jgi:hypothetical protein
VTAPGATWLDYRLVERVWMPLAMGGFGQEVRDGRHVAGVAKDSGGVEWNFASTRQDLVERLFASPRWLADRG